jgi:hypothetical protein
MIDEGEQEARLERLARGLGAGAAERLDVERTASAVLERLRHERTVRRLHVPAPRWWRIAAVVVVMLGAGLLVRNRFLPPQGGQTPQYLSEDLQGLSTEQLQQVLGTLDETLTDSTPLMRSDEDLNGMTTEQLRAVLRSLEG